MVQAFNVGSNSTGELRSFVDAAFGTEYTSTRAQSDRDFVWAQIDIRGPIDRYASVYSPISDLAPALQD